MNDPFFIGWQSEAISRRQALRTAGAAILGGGLLGGAMALTRPATTGGVWDLDDIRNWPGRVIADPYPMLLTKALDGTPRLVLLVTEGKCAVRSRLTAAVSAGGVAVRGSLLRRENQAMLAAVDGEEWLIPVPAMDMPIPERINLGQLRAAGELLDSKCWFGGMRPGHGKAHKACAALCVRGGIPPALHTVIDGKPTLLLLTDQDDRPWGEAILPFVGDQVQVSGRLFRQGDQLTLAIDPGMLQRL
jgi:hypothetical protein